MNTRQYYGIQLITIDLDGTLVDSIADLHAAVAKMQTDVGQLPASLESVRNWIGNGIERLVHRALTDSMDVDADPVLFSEALERFKIAYDDANGTASALYPGVRHTLDWLTTLDIPLVCVTNKAGQFSRPLLESLDIDRYFSHHIAGDDVASKKPDPEALHTAARYCDALPACSVMIGDSLSDIKAARAAGFAMICVSYGYNHGAPVQELKGILAPDVIIDTFDELPRCLPTLFAD